MWKECYRIGDDRIDSQHMELFRMVDELLKIVSGKSSADDSPDLREECKAAITFLKNYAVQHFADEEKIQQEVGYSGYEEHKKIHGQFVASVLEYEKKMIESDFDIAVIRDFTGMLTTWLVYHVTGEDQKITKGAASARKESSRSILKEFSDCACEVLCGIVGLDEAATEKIYEPEAGVAGDISISLRLTNNAGDITGIAGIVFTKELSIKIYESMLGDAAEELDDIACSMLFEAAHIMSDKASAELSGLGVDCRIAPDELEMEPLAFNAANSVALHTAAGVLGVHIQYSALL